MGASPGTGIAPPPCPCQALVEVQAFQDELDGGGDERAVLLRPELLDGGVQALGFFVELDVAGLEAGDGGLELNEGLVSCQRVRPCEVSPNSSANP